MNILLDHTIIHFEINNVNKDVEFDLNKRRLAFQQYWICQILNDAGTF